MPVTTYRKRLPVQTGLESFGHIGWLVGRICEPRAGLEALESTAKANRGDRQTLLDDTRVEGAAPRPGSRPGDRAPALRAARDLFARDSAPLSTEEFFRLWQGIEEEVGDPRLPLRIGSVISVESFNPMVFAAFCSKDLNTALPRIAR